MTYIKIFSSFFTKHTLQNFNKYESEIFEKQLSFLEWPKNNAKSWSIVRNWKTKHTFCQCRIMFSFFHKWVCPWNINPFKRDIHNRDLCVFICGCVTLVGSRWSSIKRNITCFLSDIFCHWMKCQASSLSFGFFENEKKKTFLEQTVNLLTRTLRIFFYKLPSLSLLFCAIFFEPFWGWKRKKSCGF